MQASMFNVRVPLDQGDPQGDEVFLMNTFTDAQLVVSRDVLDLIDRVHLADDFSPAERETIEQLVEQGFLVTHRDAERDDLRQFFREVRDNTDTLKVTVLTTLQCNFACDYCIQGDHGEYNKHAAKMSLEMSARVVAWVESRLDEVGPRRLVLTFFGGEPLLNMPVLYDMAERLHAACASRGVELLINIITNGLLLSREMVERLNPLGLNGIKITLDGDRDAHNRARPLRGGQGTFDRIIANTRAVADLTRIAVGGNFDVDTVDSYPALLDFLAAQDFAPRLSKVTFKPVIREKSAQTKGIIPLTAVGSEGKPLNGACMTSAGTGVSRVCDTCNFVDDQMAFLREETKKRGFSTADGVHMGPCENPQGPRLHDRPGRVALRVSRIRGRGAAVHRPHRRAPRGASQPRPAQLRAAGGVGAVPGLRVHPGLRRRLHRGLPQRARRHARAELPQDEFRSGPRGPRPRRGARASQFSAPNQPATGHQ